jgi:hypothetical protein
VHEDNCSIFWQDYIRASRQFSRMKPETQANRMQTGSDCAFRLSILASDSGHVFSPLFLSKNIHSINFAAIFSDSPFETQSLRAKSRKLA